ncbi:MAG: UDP-3-O-acyl-N-acetylglucosamine deacetylase [bacterium]
MSKPFPKRTINSPVKVSGKGLFLGRPCEVILEPAQAGAGILIQTPVGDLAVSPDAVVESSNFTFLKKGDIQVFMVEHLFAALHGLRVGNLLIRLSGEEMPILDGSALPWAEAILHSGLVEQNEPWTTIEPAAPLAEYEGDHFLGAFPGSHLKIGYYFSHPHPHLGRAYFEWEYDEAGFVKDIAPARTFATEQEWEALKGRGLAQAVTGGEGVLFTDRGPHTPLRFPNEPLRHKILDMLGDLFIAGVWLSGFVMGFRSGHLMNHRLAKQLAAMKSEGASA